MLAAGDVWLVVLTWNGRADTLECLASLQGAAVDPPHVLLVDNASDDGTVEAVRKRFGSVELLVNERNLGYAEGNNRGIARALDAGAAAICVLNNDTIAEAGFLDRLLEHSRAGRALSPDIVYASDPAESWFRGGIVDVAQGTIRHLARPEQPQGGEPFASQTLTGCCLFAEAATWRRVGFFDPRMFLIFEDGDWSLRAREQGIELLVVPASRVRHKVSRSFVGTAAGLGLHYYTRNGLLFAWRHLGAAGTARFFVRSVLMPLAREVRHDGRAASSSLPRVTGTAAALFQRWGAAGGAARFVARRTARPRPGQ